MQRLSQEESSNTAALALVEEGVPVVGYLKRGREDMLSNITEAKKSRGADVIGVGEKEIDGFEYFIEIPEDQKF